MNSITSLKYTIKYHSVYKCKLTTFLCDYKPVSNFSFVISSTKLRRKKWKEVNSKNTHTDFFYFLRKLAATALRLLFCKLYDTECSNFKLGKRKTNRFTNKNHSVSNGIEGLQWTFSYCLLSRGKYVRGLIVDRLSFSFNR